jgi:putative glutamine amidotransferase
VLAICRGIQVLNVAAGGSLYQDLGAQWPGALKHDNTPLAPETPWQRPVHPVQIQQGSRLAHLAHAGELKTNSFHHQAVKKVADGFVVTAWAPDGVVEAIEAPKHTFAVGVQWHPEAMTRVDETARRLFEAFVEAAADRQGGDSPGC